MLTAMFKYQIDVKSGCTPYRSRALNNWIAIGEFPNRRLPDSYIDGIVETVWTPGVGCGAFSFGLDCNHDTSPEFELQPRDKYGWFFLWTMRMVEGWVHQRCKSFELPFGDQVGGAKITFIQLSVQGGPYLSINKGMYLDLDYDSDRSINEWTASFLIGIERNSPCMHIVHQVLFLRRSVFSSLGGFRADHPIMEDIDLVNRVKTTGAGHVSVSTSCGPAVTSCRRWYGNCLGLIGVTGFNQVQQDSYKATAHQYHPSECVCV